MTTRTRKLIKRMIERARTIAAAIEQFDPLAAAAQWLEAWQLETILQAEHRQLATA